MLERFPIRAVVMLAIASLPARAQFSAGADLAWRSRWIWRGLDRVTHAVLQPAVYAGLQRGPLVFDGGVWANVEPLAAGDGERSIRGRQHRGLSALEYWLQGTLEGGRYAALTLGALAYGYQGDASLGGTPPTANTQEAFVRGEMRWPWRVEHELTYWYDVDRVHGQFAEYTLRRALPLFPELLPPTLVVGATIGWSHGQRVTPDEPGYFARDGFRYVDVSLRTVPVYRLWRLPFAVGGALHYQGARGDGTVVAASPPVLHAWWAELTLSVPAARPEEP